MAEVIQRNARGGIDKLSNREALGARPQGATGTGQSFAIPVTKLQPATPAQIPPPPLPEDPGNLVGANNTAIAPTLAPHGFSLDANGQFAYTPPKETTDSTSGYDKIFSQYLGLQEAPKSTADIYANEASAAGLTDKQNAVSRLTGRLNSIVAKNQADQLRLEQANSSNDVSKGVFNAQVARLNREAAIAALPVQAQLAAAQGDYEMAQQHVDKMYQIKSQDALAQYQWKNKVLDSVYSFANAQEQRRLDDLKVKEDRKYTEQQDFLKTQRSLLSSALQQGAPSSVISAIGEATTVLDVLTAAGQYNGDVLARQIQQAQLRKLNEAPGPSAPEVKNINGVDMQWNPQTKEWETIGAGSGLTPKDEQTLKSATDTLSKVDNLLTHPGFNSSVGPFNITRVALTDAFGNKQDFIASVENLVSQQTLNALTDLKARGGTLGALSEKELKILESTASKISSWRQLDPNGNITGYNTSETRFKAELADMQKKLKQAQKDVLGYDPSLLPAQDSSIIDMYVTTDSTPTFNPASVY